MRDYIKPFIEDEEVEIEDICGTSGIGNNSVSDTLDDTNEDISPWPFG